jgi:hypothetical protein
MTGGSINTKNNNILDDNFYKKKYLSYKIKYLKLKNQ